MHVLRGRADSIEADRALSRGLGQTVAETGDPAVRVWSPHRHVAFGPRDRNHPDYETAKALARESGFPPVERSVGGRAVAFTGRTLAVAVAEPADRTDVDLRDRYDRATEAIRGALEGLGATLQDGEPAHSFCPGSHSLSVEGGKVVGLAQRVTGDVARVGAVIVVDGHEPIREVLGPIYDALDVPFDPATVGSLAADGVDAALGRVRRSIEDAFVGDREAAVERVRET